MLASLGPEEQAAAWREIAARLAQFEHDGRFEGPCEPIVGVGTCP